MRTNDPTHLLFTLTVTGKVVKFAEVNPAQVHLEGQAGTPLAVEVEIVPNSDYPFSIVGVKSNRDDSVRGELIQQCNAGANSRCVLRVENLRTTSGRYADTITVQTDNAARPSLSIPVVGIIR